MSQHIFDRYIGRISPVHRLDARVKLLLALAFIVCASLLPAGSWLALAALTSTLWATVAVSRVGLRTIVRRSLLALPFLLVTLTLVFTVPGRPVWQLSLGFVTLTASEAGLLRFAAVLWRAWISVQAALLLTATTPFTELLRALRALRLPAILVATLALAYRYLFVLVDEVERLLRARESRSAQGISGSGGTLLWRANVTGRMAGTLLLRAFERSERTYIAMLSRGYNGELRALEQPALSRRDLLSGLLGALLLLLIVAQAYAA